MTDQLQRFLFDDFEIRGEIAQAHTAFEECVSNHDYPVEVANTIGELLIATSLLTATLKFKGKIAVQIQGDGPLSMAVINANQNLEVRGTARYQGDTTGLSFSELIGKGNLMITITPDNGERYQGIVALEKGSLAACLEDYFVQSEQLATKISLFADSTSTPVQAAGLLIQTLPAHSESHEEDFAHVCALANTIKAEEIYTLQNDDLLFRLYHQEKVRLFEVQPISFVCGCSEERCLSSLASLDEEEIKDILEEQESIDMRCEYCATTYSFKEKDLQILFTSTNQKH
ncbi:Hsp33 family molecular chaperone HslO [Psychromonas sp. 14N.309.X.WAT.B.A12]|uniref:Hsp33 family molecular chaperone HslO n=1 Tax=unclassified Psychromonas TaxID=2614957 RepID=UPI0025B22B47|nr:Hsp33 family molecular chaperone HslO [Psychromonas sp. 14N.309.X.WAT.B.A12]MDN2664463.1 Hsp33 family molecular chaperone HslO [Psychromonas sp. 14N.309.X.WAT.B.A12]